MKEKWKIWVSGYGEFDFEGSEDEAEEMRVHKSNWERGRGEKYRANKSTPLDKVTAEIVALWSSGKGVPQSLMSKRRRLRESAAVPRSTD